MSTIDVNLINPFIGATVNTLQTMAFIEPKRKNLYLKKDNKMYGDVSGVMGISGEITGNIIVSFPEALAIKVVSNMLGENFTEVTPDVEDGIGEVVNMIAGQAKTELANTPYHFKMSIPTVVVGKDHRLSHKADVPCIVAEFDADGESFAVEVSLKPASNG